MRGIQARVYEGRSGVTAPPPLEGILKLKTSKMEEFYRASKLPHRVLTSLKDSSRKSFTSCKRGSKRHKHV